MKSMLLLGALAVLGSASFAQADGYVAVAYNSLSGYASDGVTYVNGGTYGTSGGVYGDPGSAESAAIAACQAASPATNNCGASTNFRSSNGFITLFVGLDSNNGPHFQMKPVSAPVAGTPFTTQAEAQNQCNSNALAASGGAQPAASCTERVFISAQNVYQN